MPRVEKMKSFPEQCKEPGMVRGVMGSSGKHGHGLFFQPFQKKK